MMETGHVSDGAASASGVQPMDEVGKANSQPPWHERSGTEWSLRAGPRSMSRILMRRLCDGDGLNLDGKPAPWRDVATFDSYNDADEVLRVLQRHLR